MSDWWIDETLPVEPLTYTESLRLDKSAIVETITKRGWSPEGEATVTQILTRENMEGALAQLDVLADCDVIVNEVLVGRLTDITYRAIPSPNSTPFNRIMISYHEVHAILTEKDRARL